MALSALVPGEFPEARKITGPGVNSAATACLGPCTVEVGGLCVGRGGGWLGVRWGCYLQKEGTKMGPALPATQQSIAGDKGEKGGSKARTLLAPHGGHGQH